MLALGALALALLAAEGFARVYAPQPPLAAGPRGAFVRPGDHPSRSDEYDVVVHVNTAGWVDREWGPKAGPRIVLIGDSFIQAAQVPLDAGIGRVMDAALPGDVLSLGVPGAGTGTALDLLATALPLEPDLVLLGFLSANDVMNNHPALEEKRDKTFYRLDDGRLVRTDPVDWSLPDAGWSRSGLLRWIARTRAERALVAEKLRLGRGLPVDLRLYDPAPDPTWEEAWTLTERLLAALSDRCARAGVAFGVLVFPGDITATESARNRMVAQWPDTKAWDVRAPHARAVAMAERVAPTLDLLPAVADAPQAWLPRDGHWTADGHRRAAQSVVAWIRAEPAFATLRRDW